MKNLLAGAAVAALAVLGVAAPAHAAEVVDPQAPTQIDNCGPETLPMFNYWVFPDNDKIVWYFYTNIDADGNPTGYTVRAHAGEEGYELANGPETFTYPLFTDVPCDAERSVKSKGSPKK